MWLLLPFSVDASHHYAPLLKLGRSLCLAHGAVTTPVEITQQKITIHLTFFHQGNSGENSRLHWHLGVGWRFLGDRKRAVGLRVGEGVQGHVVSVPLFKSQLLLGGCSAAEVWWSPSVCHRSLQRGVSHNGVYYSWRALQCGNVRNHMGAKAHVLKCCFRDSCSMPPITFILRSDSSGADFFDYVSLWRDLILPLFQIKLFRSYRTLSVIYRSTSTFFCQPWHESHRICITMFERNKYKDELRVTEVYETPALSTSLSRCFIFFQPFPFFFFSSPSQDHIGLIELNPFTKCLFVARQEIWGGISPHVRDWESCFPSTWTRQ